MGMANDVESFLFLTMSHLEIVCKIYGLIKFEVPNMTFKIAINFGELIKETRIGISKFWGLKGLRYSEVSGMCYSPWLRV